MVLLSDGSARKVLSIKNADHVGILYSENSQLSINDWVNKIMEINIVSKLII